MEVLFVCTGNTCRSPLAEVLLRKTLAENGVSGITISSAGISAQPGSPASRGSVSVLGPSEDLSSHSSRQVDKDILDQADLVLVMTTSQKEFLSKVYPEAVPKIFTLKGYALAGDFDIADPFGGSRDDYMVVRNQIEEAVQIVAEVLTKQQNKEMRKTMKIALASDHGGYRLKEEVKDIVAGLGFEFLDYGCPSEESVDYPDLASAAAKAVTAGECQLGIILCGTGQGMAIAANKIKGIRAANCHDCFSAKMARAHNNANVLTMGQRVIGSELAKMIVEIFLATSFEGQRHQKRVDKITALEEEFGQ